MYIDNPIKSATSDKLGFSYIAHHLALAFLKNDLGRGFVVGVEGPWGSGKSSMVNLAIEEIKNKDIAEVVEFAPWLVGSRSELLTQLFSDLEPVIIKLAPENEKEEIRRVLNKYAKLSSGLAAMADVAEIAGLPWAGIFKKIFKESGEKAAEISERSLSDLNSSLRNKLKLLKKPIIVFVDDLDRLDPGEVAEVLRLVKAVADFPNVAYILSYDVEIVAGSLEKAIGIKNGRSYLEKIVQASFKVPDAMNYDLKNWLRDGFEELLSDVEISEEARKRLESVYRRWSPKLLNTPRDVIRIINSLRLHFVPVKDYVDPGDMLLLHMIKSKHGNLYNWVEDYVIKLSSIQDHEDIIFGKDSKAAEGLSEALDKMDADRSDVLFGLAEVFPGIDISKGKEFDILNINPKAIKPFINERRLSSPHHFSYYFSFSRPAGSVDDSEIESFLNLCVEDPHGAIKKFREMIKAIRPQGGRLAEVLLQRIVDKRAGVSPRQVESLFSVLCEVMNDLIPYARTEAGYSQFLRGSREEVFGLIGNVEDKNSRNHILKFMFEYSKSLPWMVGIIREATLAESSDVDPIISSDEFDLIKEKFLRRISEMSPSSVIEAPYLLSTFYAWYQLGDVESVISFIRKQTIKDEDFVDVLSKVTSWSSSSSTGVQYALTKETIDTFFEGFMPVATRLSSIINNKNVNDEVRLLASNLLSGMDSKQEKLLFNK